MEKKFYITTPIYYVNDVPHIGHAYTTIIADILSRWHKLLGENVFFLTGTDEHGIKIQKTAEKNGKTPKAFVDRIVASYKEAWKKLNIEYDNFIRTTDPEHIKYVQKILQELYDKKLIYKGKYNAHYCIGCEQYKTNSELVEGKCPLHNAVPELRSEEAYLFRLSKFQNELKKLIEKDSYKIFPKERKHEVLSFLNEGLQDISISRPKSEVHWGIEIPFDKKQTCYVWIDAFLNYISGLSGKNFKKFWPADIQLMSKDILRVHATIWPVLLLAINEKLPKQLFVHGYFTINGQKMSKSLGNIIDPISLCEKYGPDSVRYFIIRNIPIGEDGDFSEIALKDRHNNELANKLGNLISRVAALAEKYGIEKTKNKIITQLKLEEIEEHMQKIELDKALALIFSFVDRCNEFIQEEKPWETKNRKILYEAADSIKAIAILLSPFMPEISNKIAKQFNFEISLENLKKPLKETKIKKSEILFKKIE
jgi:methionyl-tRNA synthetase